MSKHIFSKIAKIGEEVRAAEPMKVEFDAVSDSNKYLQKSKAYAAQVEKLNKQVSDAYYDAKALLNKADQASEQVIKVYNDYLNMIDEHGKFYSKITQQAKQMGLDIKKTELFKTNEDVLRAFYDSSDPLFVDGSVIIKTKG